MGGLRILKSSRCHLYLLHDVLFSLFQYLGSFAVQAADTSGRAEFVRQRLLSMKEQAHHLEVAVTISVSGIDVRSTKGKVRKRLFRPLSFGRG